MYSVYTCSYKMLSFHIHRCIKDSRYSHIFFLLGIQYSQSSHGPADDQTRDSLSGVLCGTRSQQVHALPRHRRDALHHQETAQHRQVGVVREWVWPGSGRVKYSFNLLSIPLKLPVFSLPNLKSLQLRLVGLQEMYGITHAQCHVHHIKSHDHFLGHHMTVSCVCSLVGFCSHS